MLLGISLAYFMVLLDTTVLAVAGPDLIAALPTDVIGVGWATTAYTMALAAALVLGGSLADRLGADRVFRVASAGFGIVSLACAVAPNLGTLLLGRAVLGLFAAGVVPSSMALLAALYAKPDDRTRAISWWAAISGAAMAVGPVLGGWLVELSGWRAVFVINAPLAVVVLLLCRKRLGVARHPRVISPIPHLGLAATLAALTLAITEAGQLHWATAFGAGCATLVLAAVTVRADRRSVAPLVPDVLRRNRPVWSAFAWGTLVNYALTTVLFAVPLVVAEGSLSVGITLLPMTVLVAVNPLLTGRLVRRFGPLVPIRLGFAAFAIGLSAVAVALMGDQRPVVLAAGLLGCGLGVSWTLPPLVGFAVSNAPAGATGAVGGILNAMRQVGATVGAATAGAVLTVQAGGVVVFVVAAGLCVVGLLLTVRVSSPGSS
ncbi:MFS transporter [Kribbella lupini]|uniref:MFS transporter n=1 Tax=Kribbella lupini TaxID=291602 RepID=A0ABP4KTI0_9ACTN